MAGARADPAEIVGVHRCPIEGGEAPILAVGREAVGRGAERRVPLELVGVRPHIGALVADDEGEIAHQLDAERAELFARLLPLHVGDPLRVLVLEDARGVRLGRARQRAGLARPLRLRPVTPPLTAVRLAKRDVEREIVLPRRLALDEGPKLARTGRVALPLALEEAIEGAAQGARLQLAHGLVVHGVARAEARQLLATGRAEHVVDLRRVEIRDGLHVDVERVQAEGRARAVRAGLARGELVRREDLHEAHPPGHQPRGEGDQIRDLADAPTATRAEREQRNRAACDPCGGHGEVGPDHTFTPPDGRARMHPPPGTSGNGSVRNEAELRFCRPSDVKPRPFEAETSEYRAPCASPPPPRPPRRSRSGPASGCLSWCRSRSTRRSAGSSSAAPRRTRLPSRPKRKGGSPGTRSKCRRWRSPMRSRSRQAEPR